MPKYSGQRAQTYSPIVLDGTIRESLYEEFVREFLRSHREALEDIDDTLKTYAHRTGFSRYKSKGNRLIEYEGEYLGDGIVAICNIPKKLFRVYAIVYFDYVAILGMGGRKPGPGLLIKYPEVREANRDLIMIRRVLDAAEEAGDFRATASGIMSKTNLIYNSEDYV